MCVYYVLWSRSETGPTSCKHSISHTLHETLRRLLMVSVWIMCCSFRVWVGCAQDIVIFVLSLTHANNPTRPWMHRFCPNQDANYVFDHIVKLAMLQWSTELMWGFSWLGWHQHRWSDLLKSATMRSPDSPLKISILWWSRNDAYIRRWCPEDEVIVNGDRWISLPGLLSFSNNFIKPWILKILDNG